MNNSRPTFAAALLAPALLTPTLARAAVTKSSPLKVATPSAPVTATALPVSGWRYVLLDDDVEDSGAWHSQLKAAGPFEARVALHLPETGEAAKSSYLLLRVEGDAKVMRLSFWRVRNGVAEKWGEPQVTVPVGQGASGVLGLTNNGEEVRALWNGRVALSAWSGGKEGRIGTSTTGKVALTGSAYQPTEPVILRDDFMTAQGPDDPAPKADDTKSGTSWRRIAGVWRTSGMMPPKVEQSVNPNPFVFRAELTPDLSKRPNSLSSGRAVASIGKWFWSDYTVSASLHPVRRDPKAPLVAALAAYRPDEANAAVKSDGSVKRDGIVGGVDFVTQRAFLRDGDTLLMQSEPFGISANQWHSFFLDPGPGTIRLIVDGVERARWNGATNAGKTSALQPAQGSVALLCEVGETNPTESNYVDFDDVRVAPNSAISDQFRTGAVGRWDDASGVWQTRADAVQGGARLKMTAGPALTLTGDAERAEGRIEANFSSLNKSTMLQPVGVAFAARDAKNYFTARVRPVKGVPVLEVVEYRNGVGRVLGLNDKLDAKLTTWPQVSVEWRDGVVTASAYGKEVTATLPQIPAGRVGAWGDGPAHTVALRNFRALGAAQPWGEGPLPSRITKDYLMDGWASNAKAWKADANGMSWHTGDFFRDAALNMPLPSMAPGASVQVLLRADKTRPDTGSQLLITRDGDNLKFVLSEEGAPVKTVTLPAPKDTAPLRFARQPLGGNKVSLRVALGTDVVLSETAPAKDEKVGMSMGVKATSTKLDWEEVKPQTSSMLDYTFTSAPVDWDAASGTWEVAERWTCTEFWGFFRGDYDISPTLWSRFATKGDYTLEAYVATPMDTTRGERSPIDLNLTVEGDGRDLGSGYSFMFGAKGRTVNRIYRGDQVAFEKPFSLPRLQESTHRDWFYVRLERRSTPKGLNFRYFVNDSLVSDYTDPNPMWENGEVGKDGMPAAGRIAFWTYNGSLSVARVRLWNDGIKAASPQVDEDTLQISAPIKNPLGSWVARDMGQMDASSLLHQVSDPAHQIMKITNPRSGGDWTTYVTRSAFDANDKPILTWNYKMPMGIDVNMYALVDGKWREVLFTGDPSNKQGMPQRIRGRMGVVVIQDANAVRPPSVDFDRSVTIGKVEGVQEDGKWHTATVDLLSLLKGANLGTKVEALAFAAPDREYMRAGLGGNHRGASYWLSDLTGGKTAATLTLPGNAPATIAEKPKNPTAVAKLPEGVAPVRLGLGGTKGSAVYRPNGLVVGQSNPASDQPAPPKTVVGQTTIVTPTLR